MIIDRVQEFSSFFKQGMSIIAIDYGTKKIGIAISTPDHKIAMPFKLIIEKSVKRQIEKIIDIINENKICAIILGIPYYMDGSDSDQTRLVRKFAEKLSKQTTLPLYLQDERLTTLEANDYLQNFGLTRKKRHAQDDATSASMLLETVMRTRG